MQMRIERRTFRNLLIPRGPSVVEVGFPKSKADQSNVNKAVWNEFGTKGSGKGFSTPKGGGFGGPIPERPFFRNAMKNNRKEYIQALRISARKIIDGRTTLREVLSKLGILAQGHIQQEITNLDSPPNSPVTIALKGSSNPLIDTGEMRQAVTWKIGDKRV